MNWSKVKLTVLVVAIMATAWTANIHRVRIQAWIWHLRHGTVVTVGNYLVPVPTNWYVQSYGRAGQMLIRLDTDDPTPYKRLKAHASMSLDEAPMLTNDQNLNLKMSLDRDSLKRQGVEPVLERTLMAGAGKVSCAGGYKPGSTGIYDVEPAAWFCNSSGLEIGVLATEPDMTQIWEIISGIRKKS